MNDDCLVCGATGPSGHVLVVTRPAKGRRLQPVGRVCSRHTLADVINHPCDCLLVSIEKVSDDLSRPLG